MSTTLTDRSPALRAALTVLTDIDRGYTWLTLKGEFSPSGTNLYEASNGWTFEADADVGWWDGLLAFTDATGHREKVWDYRSGLDYLRDWAPTNLHWWPGFWPED